MDDNKIKNDTAPSSTTNTVTGESVEPTNGAQEGEEYIHEDFEEYADDNQGGEFGDEEFTDNGDDNFEINANEGADYGEEGFGEGQVNSS